MWSILGYTAILIIGIGKISLFVLSVRRALQPKPPRDHGDDGGGFGKGGYPPSWDPKPWRIKERKETLI